MAATYKVLSALLCYPDMGLKSAVDELVCALEREELLPAENRQAISELIADLASADLIDIQARYVDLFDRTRSLSLHLFEHVHGESRDRGQAMVSLRERYRQAGLDIAANELPDYLPLFLEFLSLCPAEDTRAMLAETAHILAALAERLKSRRSAYAAVFDALVALSKIRPDAEVLAQLPETKLEDPDDLVALDRAWEETEIRFGPEDANTGSCPRVSDMLLRMDPPKPCEERTAIRELES